MADSFCAIICRLLRSRTVRVRMKEIIEGSSFGICMLCWCIMEVALYPPGTSKSTRLASCNSDIGRQYRASASTPYIHLCC